jgi:phospholipase C
MPGSSSLSSIQHIVVLMLENRSFDHMLGFLYTGSGNVSPAGQPYDGLTETLPNRAFACAGTRQGHMDDKTHTFTSPSIFGLLDSHGPSWAIYGYDAPPLTKDTFTDISGAAASHFGVFTDFTAAAAAGTLAAFTFLEPSWSSTGNSQHPNYNVALGEQLIHDVYEAVRGGPGWAQTLLVITYDEHGGCYDHVAPPSGAIPPDHDAGEFGFDFTRFGLRVPAVLVSPLIAPGTVSGSRPEAPRWITRRS